MEEYRRWEENCDFDNIPLISKIKDVLNSKMLTWH